jgi:hypothetical protein
MPGPIGAALARSDNTKELTRADDLGVLPEVGKVAQVIRDQVVRPSRVGAFHENVSGGTPSRLREVTSDKALQILNCGRARTEAFVLPFDCGLYITSISF